jgi:hypothetical protein
MSQYDYTQERSDAKSGDPHVAEPIPGRVAHPEERAIEFGLRMAWQASPAPAAPELGREDHS